jgi:two-component system, chemotaxis family, protein-glutamate methylesterase/glutaminase
MRDAPTAPSSRRDIIVIGASAGGVEALMSIFARAPQGFTAAVAVVLHRHPLFNVHLAKVLGRGAALPLIEVLKEGPLAHGIIYLYCAL